MSLFTVEGRVACVTGASSGIGRALAMALAAAGARVVGVARRAEALAGWQADAGGRTAAVTADLGDLSALPDIAHALAQPFGAPEILINAAGLNPRQHADDQTPEAWQATLDLNLTVPFFLAQAMVPAMKATGWGRIVNIASLQTSRAFPAGIAYGASKGGVGQLTRAMAEAWSRDGINANAIAPGFFPTELTNAVFSDPVRAARNAQQTCIGRNGALDDLVGPMLFLCSDASAYVTGQVLYVDGVHREMKALVYLGPERLEMRAVTDPVPAPGDILLRVTDVGICGSDMHAYLGHDDRRPAPLILGHEAAGITAEGARYTVNPLVTCGRCDACTQGRENLCATRQIISMPPREGAFAEHLAIPARNAVEIPDGVPTDKAALAEPLACGWHAVRLAARALDRPLAEARCLVLGGAIGVGAALALLAQGATRIAIAETNTRRHPILTKAGDFEVFDPSAQAGPDQVDLIVDAVGIAATRAAATAKVRPGGVIAHIGLGSGEGGLDVRRMTLQEITFFGTYTYTMADFRETATAIFDGRLGALDWVDHRPLAEGASAFADIRAGRAAAPKIILQP